MADSREHAELALSASDRWVNCPGSIFLLRTIEAPPAGPAAERGTRVHELCSAMLTEFLEHKWEGGGAYKRWPLMAKDYYEDEVDNAKSYVETIWTEILDNSITHKEW